MREEIEDYYRLALEEAGATDSSALSSLGDPHAANSGYRAVLLTAREARLLPKSAADALLPQLVMVACFGHTSAWVWLLLTAVWITVAPRIPGPLAIRLWIYRCARCAWIGYYVWLVTALHPVLWIPLIPFLVWSERLSSSTRRKIPSERWPAALYLY